MRTRRFVPTLIVLASAGLLAPAQSADDTEEGRRYALVIGVQDYKGSDLGNLRYCDADASGLAEALGALGYRVTLLTRPEWKDKDRDDLLPTAENIRDHLAALLRNRKAADTVLVAFAGHGEQLKRDGKMYFCPAKCNLDKPETLIGLDEVYDLLAHNAAGAKVLIVDACRNDPLDGEASGDPRLGSVTLPQLPDPPGGTVALFSCSKGEKSYESDELKHGFLSHFVIQGLRKEAADGKTGMITWLGLAHYVDDHVTDAVYKGKGPKAVQTPEAKGQSHGLVLGRIAPGATPPDATTTETPEREEAFDYIIDGQTKKGKRRVLTADLGGGVKMEFVRIPHGTFLMGTPRAEKGRGADETRHTVEISKAFYMGKVPATVGQFRAFVQAKGYKTEAEIGGGGYGYTGDGSSPFAKDKRFSWRNPGFDQDNSHPVVNVTWNDAQAFCGWLSQKDQKTYRLPTEAEWEYCCRAGTTTRFCSGDDVGSLKSVANIADLSLSRTNKIFPTENWDDGYAFTAPVNAPEFVGNAFGLCGMHGNVWQWCSDWYAEDYYESSPGRDPQGPRKGDMRVMRGGSWDNDGVTCRSARREKDVPGFRLPDYGFRVVCEIEPGK